VRYGRDWGRQKSTAKAGAEPNPKKSVANVCLQQKTPKQKIYLLAKCVMGRSANRTKRKKNKRRKI
jgi:hypothetical protein